MLLIASGNGKVTHNLIEPRFHDIDSTNTAANASNSRSNQAQNIRFMSESESKSNAISVSRR